MRAKTIKGWLGNLKFLFGYKLWATLTVLAVGIVIGAMLIPTSFSESDAFMWLVGAVATTAVGVFGNYVQARFAVIINNMKKRRALERIKGEPYYHVGRIIRAAWMPGTEAPFITDYYIAELSVGRMLLKQIGDSDALVMTCRDFEDLHVLINPHQCIDPETGNEMDAKGFSDV